MNIDLSIHIRRQPESENYRLDLLLIENNAPGKSEHFICQSLAEAFQKAASFESKHLRPFQNAIEYEKTDWRELARQNRAANESKKR